MIIKRKSFSISTEAHAYWETAETPTLHLEQVHSSKARQPWSCPQYRLSSGPKGRFPAALQDAVIAYPYLLGLGIAATNITLSGDSAGGHIIIALLRYLHGNNKILSLPSAALLWNSWVDLKTDPKSFDRNRNIKTAFVTSAIMTWGIERFTPSFMRTSHPYLTPRDSPFPTSVPKFLQLGGGEVLYDVGAKFVENIKGAREQD